ncbi:GIY-YIG nuclease superfamily [uncultured Caudovirales phage]|uniref:GIY-YIG nuclease superfamily n=1 Tax=uncultured Caudovirales phage TaxID=2100421 RepID=A0A6J5SRC5_9CAUD|nr:GIY-YIG nuclease superfamily [uncultured Caudovirales phage]
MTDTPHTIYRLFNSEDRLLYIGITEDWARRFKQHSRVQPWWDRVASVKLEFVDSLETAQVLEANAIKREHPLHNSSHSSDVLHWYVIWREDELDFIRENAHKGAKWLSAEMDRSPQSIYQKAYMMGVPVGTRTAARKRNEARKRAKLLDELEKERYA